MTLSLGVPLSTPMKRKKNNLSDTFCLKVQYCTLYNGSWLYHVSSFKDAAQERQLSVSGERMCTILVNRLED